MTSSRPTSLKRRLACEHAHAHVHNNDTKDKQFSIFKTHMYVHTCTRVYAFNQTLAVTFCLISTMYQFKENSIQLHWQTVTLVQITDALNLEGDETLKDIILITEQGPPPVPLI